MVKRESKAAIPALDNPAFRFGRNFFRTNAATLIGLIAIMLLLQLMTGGWNFMNGLFFRQKNVLNVLQQRFLSQ